VAFSGSGKSERYCVRFSISLTVCLDTEKLPRTCHKVLCCCLACLLQRWSKRRYPHRWPGQKSSFRGVNTLGNSTLRGCCPPFTRPMPAAGALCGVRQGVLAERGLWAGWCAATVPQRGSGLLSSAGCQDGGCSCLSLREQNAAAARRCSNALLLLSLLEGLCVSEKPLPMFSCCMLG